MGHAIAQKFKQKKFDVIVASRKSVKFKSNDFKFKKYNKNNLSLLLQNVDYIICANGPSRDSFKKNKEKILNTYVKEMDNILINCKKSRINKIIYLSSIHVLTNFKSLDENFKYYIESKKRVEKKIKKLFKKNYEKIKILRLTNIFGYFDKDNYVESFSLVKDFTYQSKKTNRISIDSKINFKRIFFPINLFLKYLVFFVENNTRKLVYNIGDKKYELTLLELANKIKKIKLIKNKKKIKILYSFKNDMKYAKQKFSFFKTKKIKNKSSYINKQISKLI